MTTTPDHPARRLDIENWLTDIGAAWTFDPDLPLHRIDQAQSLANQVRHIPLDEDAVGRYAACMVRGDVFPPLFVDARTHGILGGNHRYAAHNQAGHATTAAYLVTADERTLLRIKVEDNARHGVPTTKAERLEHALALIAAGETQRDAAAIVGIAQPDVTIAAGCADAARRATALDVDDRFAKLPQSTRYQLSQVADDAVFAPLADLTVTCGLPNKDVKRLVRAVAGTDQHEALRMIGAEASDWEDQARQLAGNVRTAGRTARARLDSALAEIIALDPAEIAATCPNTDVMAVLADRIMRAAAVLSPTHELLTAKTKVRAA